MNAPNGNGHPRPGPVAPFLMVPQMPPGVAVPPLPVQVAVGQTPPDASGRVDVLLQLSDDTFTMVLRLPASEAAAWAQALLDGVKSEADKVTSTLVTPRVPNGLFLPPGVQP